MTGVQTCALPIYQDICLGDWSYQVRDQLNRMSPEQKALTLLAQAKKTMMMGYRSGSNPYIRLNRGDWDNWITKQECDSRGLVVLNDFGGA